ncbi:MAG TPA: ribonucleotide-diphosphate reductase subunit beta [Savagea sp.]
MSIQKSTIISPVFPNRATKMFGGEASGILNWNDLKYSFFYELREEIRANFWIAAEVDMGEDARSFDLFDEQEAFLEAVGRLMLHNAMQDKLSNTVANYASDPSVTSIFATMYDQNSEHHQGLSYILSNVTSVDQQRKVLALEEPLLESRARYFEELVQGLEEEATQEMILMSLASLALFKGMQYHSQFVQFYEYALRGEMRRTSQLIGRIHKDRLAQLKFLGELFRVSLTESKLDKAEIQSLVHNRFDEDARAEIVQFPERQAFIEYRTNRVLFYMGLSALYEVSENPEPIVDEFTTFSDEQTAKTNDGIDLDGFDDL